MLTHPLWLRDLAAASFQAAALVIVASLLPPLLRLRAPRVRLMYWQLLLAACLVLPVVEPWRPEPAAQNAGAVVFSIGQEVSGASVAMTRPFPWAELILGVLLTGVVLRLLWVCLGLARLRAYRKRSRPLDGAANSVHEAQGLVAVAARMYVSHELASPATFGLRSPTVILPERFLELSLTHQRAIACHELLHVGRRDWVWNLAEEFVLSLLWFHPAIWWVVRNIRLSREQTVDAEVIRLTRARKDYLEALLEIARQSQNARLAPAALFLRESQLAARVALLVKEVAMSKRKLIAVSVVSAAVLLATGGFAVWAFPLRSPPTAGIAQDVTSPGPGIPGGVEGGVSGGVSGGVEGGVSRGVETERHVDFKQLTPIHRALPKYPPLARMAKVEGTVVLDVAVNKQGEVTDERVMSGPPLLVQAALYAARQWRFALNRLLPASTTMTFNFQSAPEVLSTGTGQRARRSEVRPADSEGRLVRSIDIRDPFGQITIQQAMDGLGFDVTKPYDQKKADAVRTAIQDLYSQRGIAVGVDENIALIPPDSLSVTFIVYGADKNRRVSEKRSSSLPAPRVIIRPNQASGSGPAGAQAGSVPGGESVTEKSSDLKLIHSVTPVYPPLARMARIQSAVVLDATVDADGNVTDEKVVSGHPLLVQSALDAVRQFKFAPPANPPATTTVTINFRLPPEPAPPAGPIIRQPIAGPAPPSPQTGANGASSSGGRSWYHAEQYGYDRASVRAHRVSMVRALYMPDPPYPKQARDAKLQGHVILTFVIGTDGRVENVKEVSKPLGKGLDESATKTVRQWKFKPETSDGKPVPAKMRVDVTFLLF